MSTSKPLPAGMVAAPPTVVKVIRSRKAQWGRWFWGYFFVAPSFLFFLSFSLYPLTRTVLLSFQRVNIGAGADWVGLGNYRNLVADRVFWDVLATTVTYFLGIVPIGTLLTLMLAALVFQLPERIGSIFKAAYYLPSVASGVALSFIWLYIYHPSFGLLNYFLSMVGIEPVLWLANPRTALWSLVFMYHATSWGGSVVLVCAALGGIPNTLYEAATIDGASRLRQFISITIPLLKPVLTYVVIMSTISSLRIFNQIFLMTRGGPGWSTTNLVYHVYTTAFQNFEFGIGSSMVMLLLVVTMMLAIVQYRYLALDVEY